jgi:hypothetical protein
LGRHDLSGNAVIRIRCLLVAVRRPPNAQSTPLANTLSKETVDIETLTHPLQSYVTNFLPALRCSAFALRRPLGAPQAPPLTPIG